MITGLKSPQVNSMSGEQLDRAFLEVYDLMTRVLLAERFVVLGQAAECLFRNRALEGESLEFGIPKREVTPEVVITLKEWVPKGEFTDRGFSYVFDGIPIKFTYITRKYDFFKEPDVKLYMPEFYRIANPFNDYWKIKQLIR